MIKYILMTLGILFSLLITSFYSGWILTLLWGWFIMPVFGLPSLTLLQAMGLSLFVAFITYKKIDYDTNKTEAEAIKSFVSLFVGTLMTYSFILGFGYILQLFM